ncbi:MAG: ABC transporter permease subunit [Acidimicrobiales bacterium]
MTAPQRAPGAAPTVGTGAARILDRGYRRYAGERGGVDVSMRSVVKYTSQRVLGIHRKFRFKVMPILTIVISYVPHMVYVGIVVLTNRLDEQQQISGGGPVPAGAGRLVANQLIKDYPSSYTNIVAAIALFAAFIAPEVLCTDRRSGMLGLYMASPLNRWTYLASKGISVGMILLTVTLGPSVLLLIGYSTQGYGPSSLADWASTIGRVLATGVGLALFHTMVSCAISSITTRRAAASAAFVVLIMGTGVLVPFLVIEAKAPVWLGVFDLLRLPTEFGYRVFGQISYVGYEGREVTPTWIVYAGFVGWIVVSALVVFDRYRRVEVTK